MFSLCTGGQTPPSQKKKGAQLKHNHLSRQHVLKFFRKTRLSTAHSLLPSPLKYHIPLHTDCSPSRMGELPKYAAKRVNERSSSTTRQKQSNIGQTPLSSGCRGGDFIQVSNTAQIFAELEKNLCRRTDQQPQVPDSKHVLKFFRKTHSTHYWPLLPQQHSKHCSTSSSVLIGPGLLGWLRRTGHNPTAKTLLTRHGLCGVHNSVKP